MDEEPKQIVSPPQIAETAKRPDQHLFRKDENSDHNRAKLTIPNGGEVTCLMHMRERSANIKTL